MRGPPISLPDAAAQVFKDLPTIKQLTLANLNGSLAVVHGPAPSMDFWTLLRAVPIKKTSSFYNIGYRTKKVLLFNPWFL